MGAFDFISDKAKKLAALLADSAATGATMYGQGHAPADPELTKSVLGFLPGVGDAISGYDAYDSARQGNYGEAALNAVGVVPGIPSLGIIGSMKTIKTEKALADAIRSGDGQYIRWSRGPSLDKKIGGSRDFVAGVQHEGLSAVPINPEWADDAEWMARRVGEYGFLRMKDSKIAPYIYSGKNVGVDSDGYALIKNVDGVAKISPELIDSLKEMYKRK